MKEAALSATSKARSVSAGAGAGRSPEKQTSAAQPQRQTPRPSGERATEPSPQSRATQPVAPKRPPAAHPTAVQRSADQKPAPPAQNSASQRTHLQEKTKRSQSSPEPRRAPPQQGSAQPQQTIKTQSKASVQQEAMPQPSVEKPLTEAQKQQSLLNKVRQSAGKQFETLGNDINLNQTTSQIREKADGLGVNIQSKLKQSKDALDEFSLAGKVKDFTLASVKVAQDIDAELQKDNYQYEVNNFRVSASAGMMAGMTLDIHFTKTSGAKKISEEASKYLAVVNPNTGKALKVLRTAIIGKETIKMKDPETGEVIIADSSGKVIEVKQPSAATENA